MYIFKGHKHLKLKCNDLEILSILSDEATFRKTYHHVGLAQSVACQPLARQVMSLPPGLGHTKDHHKNGTNCLPAWHVMR